MSRAPERGQKDAELDAGPRIWCQEAPWTKEKVNRLGRRKEQAKKKKIRKSYTVSHPFAKCRVIFSLENCPMAGLDPKFVHLKRRSEAAKASFEKFGPKRLLPCVECGLRGPGVPATVERLGCVKGFFLRPER